MASYVKDNCKEDKCYKNQWEMGVLKEFVELLFDLESMVIDGLAPGGYIWQFWRLKSLPFLWRYATQTIGTVPVHGYFYYLKILTYLNLYTWPNRMRPHYLLKQRNKQVQVGANLDWSLICKYMKEVVQISIIHYICITLVLQ